MQTKATLLLRNIWLPLYLLLSVSWLFAPALHHNHIHQLQLISSYEAFGQSYGWLFRLCDILAFSILAVAGWRSIGQKSPFHFRLLLIIAILAGIDAIFASSDLHQSGWYKFSFTIHDIESAFSAISLAALSIYDALQRRKIVSLLFLAVQATCGALALLTIGNHELVTIIQYIYTTAGIAWLAWLVCSFKTRILFSHNSALVWRRAFAAWAALNGVALILISFLPAHQHYPWLVRNIDHGYVWVAQHGVIAGIIMLYLARHVLQGQRRAAVLVGALLFSQIIIYSIVQPVPLLLLLTLLAYAALWYSMPVFRKNIGAPKVASRLADAAVILAGALLAIGLVFAIVTITGKQAYLQRTIKRAYNTNILSDAPASLRHKDEALEHSARRLKHVSYTLSAAIGIALLWSLFRPTRRPNQSQITDKKTVEQLLQRYSRSSEDYFKLWPEDKSYFFDASRSGFIAYKVTGRTAFALADPVCAPQEQTQLLADFTNFCHEQGFSVCVVLIDATSTHLYTKPFSLLKIGSSAIIDIDHFQSTTARNKWWRWQRNRAHKAGYTYSTSTPPHSQQLLQQTQALSHRWLTRAHHKEQSFALGYYDRAYLQDCILHTLRDKEGQLIAFANQLPTYNHNKQATVDLIRFDATADGAMPVLIMHLINNLAKDGNYTHFDLGFVPLAKIDTPVANVARRFAINRFSAAGLEQFKGKFQPEWRINYLAYDGDLVDLAAILTNLNRALKGPGNPSTRHRKLIPR